MRLSKVGLKRVVVCHESYEVIGLLKRSDIEEAHVIRLREDELRSHYCYVIVAPLAVVIIDTPTDYSGTGFRIKRELDNFLREKGVVPILHEWDFGLYWLLKCAFSGVGA